MNFTGLILLASILTTIGTYIDKKIIDKGISRKNYFYYMCLTMIPFSIISLYFEFKTNNFKFDLNIVPIMLLFLAALLRFFKQKSYVKCFRKLEPYEFKTYMSLVLIICYIIDLIIGTQTFSILKILAIVLIILGLLITCNVKININKIGKDLVIRLIADVIIGYTVYCILKYWSSGIYMLILNIILVLIFTPIYQPYKKDKISGKMFWLILFQQIFGFTYTYIINYLSGKSVTLSRFVSPISLIMIALTAYLIDRDKKPTFVNFIGIILSAIGIAFINLF